MKILVFAPHNDDEILGVGGTIKNTLILDMKYMFARLRVVPNMKYFRTRQEMHIIFWELKKVFFKLAS